MFKDVKVFVTGGANGIGKSIVEAFCLADAFVYFCDLDRNAARYIVEKYPHNTEFHCIDVARKDALSEVINSVINRCGNLDIIVNNVGIGGLCALEENNVDNFDRIISTNLRPVFITSQALIAHRNKMSGGRKLYGRIVNIASTRYLQSEPGWEAYAASKGGIVSLTHALAMSFSEYNVTVNCISPGWIAVNNYDKLTPQDHAQHPSGRVGEPADIARMCLFLCQPENDFINGQNIVIDGGMTKKMIYTD